MINNVEYVVESEQKIDKLAMMRGYLEMSKINMSICEESFHAANETELNQYKFLAEH